MAYTNSSMVVYLKLGEKTLTSVGDGMNRPIYSNAYKRHIQLPDFSDKVSKKRI